MVHRCLLSLAVAAHLAAPSAGAQDRLTEPDAVARALARSPVDALIDAEAADAHAVGLIEGAWANPELGYTREETFGNGGTGEDYAYVSQRIEISGRLSLRREAADLRAAAARITGASRRADVAAQVRVAFYRTMAASERAAALDEWRRHIEAALGSVERRADAGDAARYDALRLRRELRIVTAHRDRAVSDRAATEASLAALLGVEHELTLVGVLAPEAVDRPPVPTEPPSLRALATLEDAAERDREASSRAWIPELLLGAGYKGVATYVPGAPRLDGFTLTVGFTLPIFDTGAGLSERDGARARAASARLEFEEVTFRAETSSLVARIEGLRGTLEALIRERGSETDVLVTIAAAAYEGGEASLIELLDAHRSAAEDAALEIELALELRLAVIELDRSRGIE